MAYNRNLLEVIAADHGVSGCPFCGHAPDIADDETGFGIHCMNPECSVNPVVYMDNEPGISGKPGAVAAWNRREDKRAQPAGAPDAISHPFTRRQIIARIQRETSCTDE